MHFKPIKLGTTEQFNLELQNLWIRKWYLVKNQSSPPIPRNLWQSSGSRIMKCHGPAPAKMGQAEDCCRGGAWRLHASYAPSNCIRSHLPWVQLQQAPNYMSLFTCEEFIVVDINVETVPGLDPLLLKNDLISMNIESNCFFTWDLLNLFSGSTRSTEDGVTTPNTQWVSKYRCSIVCYRPSPK